MGTEQLTTKSTSIAAVGINIIYAMAFYLMQRECEKNQEDFFAKASEKIKYGKFLDVYNYVTRHAPSFTREEIYGFYASINYAEKEGAKFKPYADNFMSDVAVFSKETKKFTFNRIIQLNGKKIRYTGIERLYDIQNQRNISNTSPLHRENVGKLLEYVNNRIKPSPIEIQDTSSVGHALSVAASSPSEEFISVVGLRIIYAMALYLVWTEHHSDPDALFAEASKIKYRDFLSTYDYVCNRSPSFTKEKIHHLYLASLPTPGETLNSYNFQRFANKFLSSMAAYDKRTEEFTFNHKIDALTEAQARSIRFSKLQHLYAQQETGNLDPSAPLHRENVQKLLLYIKEKFRLHIPSKVDTVNTSTHSLEEVLVADTLTSFGTLPMHSFFQKRGEKRATFPRAAKAKRQKGVEFSHFVPPQLPEEIKDVENRYRPRGGH